MPKSPYAALLLRNFPKKKIITDTQAIEKIITEDVPDFTCNDVLASTRRKLATAAQKRFQARSPSNLACFEPCSFPNCMSSCWKNFDEDNHVDHVCSKHSVKVKPMTQQLEYHIDNTPPTPAQRLLDDVFPERVLQGLDSDDDWTEPSVVASESDADSQKEDPERDRLHRSAHEEATGQLDFDYDVYQVQPSAQLKNRLKSYVSNVWEVMSEENASHG